MKMSEQALRTAIALCLWILSAFMMAALFMELAGSNILSKVVACIWAILLHGSMVLCWRMGGWARVVTILLEGVTVIGAFILAFNTLAQNQEIQKKNWEGEVFQTAPFKELSQDLDTERELKAILSNRLKILPPDFTTAAGNLQSSIDEVTQKIEKIKSSREQLVSLELSKKHSSSGVFQKVAGENGFVFELILLTVISFLTEIAALALTSKESRNRGEEAKQKPKRKSNVRSATVDQYLKISFENPCKNGFPGGYRTVAKKLDISERQARKIRNTLVSEGKMPF